MSITRIEIEQVVARRLGGFLAEAGMDALQDGVNPWLTDPLRWALSMLGYATASFTSVTDDDLAPVADGHVEALLDLCELRMLESIQTNLASVDVTAGPLQEKRSQLATALAEIITERRKIYGARHGHLLDQPLSDEAIRRAVLRAL